LPHPARRVDPRRSWQTIFLAFGLPSVTMVAEEFTMLFRSLALLVLAASVSWGQDVAVDAPLGDGVTADTLDTFFAKLKDDGEKPRYPMLSVDGLETGHIGRLPYAFDPSHPSPFVKTEILSVIDKSALLVNVNIYTLSRTVTPSRFGKAVVGPERPDHTKTIQLIVRGDDTSDAVDGQVVQFTGSWKVTGTESYSSVGGSKRTVHVIEPTRIVLPK
jgi:hypothetical protein